jgi:hypothetical protein
MEGQGDAGKAGGAVSFGFGGWKVQKKQKIAQPNESLSHVFGDLASDEYHPPASTLVAFEKTGETTTGEGTEIAHKRKANDMAASIQDESKLLQEEGNSLAEAGLYFLNCFDRF